MCGGGGEEGEVWVCGYIYIYIYGRWWFEMWKSRSYIFIQHCVCSVPREREMQRTSEYVWSIWDKIEIIDAC